MGKVGKKFTYKREQPRVAFFLLKCRAFHQLSPRFRHFVVDVQSRPELFLPLLDYLKKKKKWKKSKIGITSGMGILVKSVSHCLFAWDKGLKCKQIVKLPLYISGIPFSKYTKAGNFSIPYSLASSELSIFTKVTPILSHSSSIFSSSFNTLSDFLSLLSSVGVEKKSFN